MIIWFCSLLSIAGGAPSPPPPSSSIIIDPLYGLRLSLVPFAHTQRPQSSQSVEFYSWPPSSSSRTKVAFWWRTVPFAADFLSVCLCLCLCHLLHWRICGPRVKFWILRRKTAEVVDRLPRDVRGALISANNMQIETHVCDKGAAYRIPSTVR